MPPAFNLSQDQTLQLKPTGPKTLCFELNVQPQASLLTLKICCYLQRDTQRYGLLSIPRASAQVTCAHCQRSVRAEGLSPPAPLMRFARGSRTSYGIFRERQHLFPYIFFLPSTPQLASLGEGARTLTIACQFGKGGARKIQPADTKRTRAKLRLPIASTASNPGT